MTPVSFVVNLLTVAATQRLGYYLGQYCQPGMVLLISGNLGSGKTTLVQGLGYSLGIDEPIGSPTFALVNEYLEGCIPLYHVDLYRLEPCQVESLELETYWDGEEFTPGVVIIEWAERMVEYPKRAIHLMLRHRPSGGRQATLTASTEPQIAFLEKVVGDGLLVNEV